MARQRSGATITHGSTKRPGPKGKRRPAVVPSLSLGKRADVDQQTYSAVEVEEVGRLPAVLVRSLTLAGHLPSGEGRQPVSYTVESVLMMRIASAMSDAKIPVRQIVIALSRFREGLPAGSSLSIRPVAVAMAATAATAAGKVNNDGAGLGDLGHVAPGLGSRAGRSARFHIIDHRPPSETALRRRAASERKRLAAEEHFAAALELEESDVAAARARYLAALAADSSHLEARINLGRLLHLNGELAEAEAVYRAARHASAMLSFNLAILLEDLSREEEAMLAYREALALDPTLHDAHFNLSQLHERAKRPQEALRHLLAYRRHVAQKD